MAPKLFQQDTWDGLGHPLALGGSVSTLQSIVGMAETIKLWQDTLERLAEAGQFPGGSLVTKYPFQVV